MTPAGAAGVAPARVPLPASRGAGASGRGDSAAAFADALAKHTGPASRGPRPAAPRDTAPQRHDDHVHPAAPKAPKGSQATGRPVGDDAVNSTPADTATDQAPATPEASDPEMPNLQAPDPEMPNLQAPDPGEPSLEGPSLEGPGLEGPSPEAPTPQVPGVAEPTAGDGPAVPTQTARAAQVGRTTAPAATSPAVGDGAPAAGPAATPDPSPAAPTGATSPVAPTGTGALTAASAAQDVPAATDDPRAPAVTEAPAATPTAQPATAGGPDGSPLSVQSGGSAGTAAAASTSPASTATGAPITAAPRTLDAPAPVPAAAPAGPAPLPAQLTPRLAALRAMGEGTHRITMRVQPESIGSVRVVAEVTASGTRIELHGGTEAAREALRVALPDLKRDLLVHGMLAELDLGTPGGRDGHGRPDAPESFSSSRTRREDAEIARKAAEITTATRSSVGRGRVDVMT